MKSSTIVGTHWLTTNKTGFSEMILSWKTLQLQNGTRILLISVYLHSMVTDSSTFVEFLLSLMLFDTALWSQAWGSYPIHTVGGPFWKESTFWGGMCKVCFIIMFSKVDLSFSVLLLVLHWWTVFPTELLHSWKLLIQSPNNLYLQRRVVESIFLYSSENET